MRQAPSLESPAPESGTDESLLCPSLSEQQPPPFRILHQTPASEVSYCKLRSPFGVSALTESCPSQAVACALNKADIFRDWDWLEKHLMPTLEAFEKEEEVTEFVRCKVESILAQQRSATCSDALQGSGDSSHFKAAAQKFARTFEMPEEEKLVNCELARDGRKRRSCRNESAFSAQTTPAATSGAESRAKDGST